MDLEESFGSFAFVIVAILIVAIPAIFMLAWNSFMTIWLPEIGYWQALSAIFLLGTLKGVLQYEVKK